MDYPYEGQVYPAKNKKYEELVFFVPFYEGTKPQLQKHIDFVNELGFDAFAFHLSKDPLAQLSEKDMSSIARSLLKGVRGLFTKEKMSFSLPSLISSTGEFGLRHIYADQIELLLNAFSQPKIVYSFSNPSHSAIKALSRRQCSDIKALICDSGPAAKNFVGSVRRLNFTQKFPGKKLQTMIATGLMSSLWGLHVEEDLYSYLESFPKDFPLLSIRGWKDPLIQPAEIDAAFEGHDHLRWTKLSLPEAAHLNGLRDFPSEYKPQVQSFLKRHAREISEGPSPSAPPA